MQSEHSSSLKAGSTKNKNSAKTGINAQVRYYANYTARRDSVVLKLPWAEQRHHSLRWKVMLL